MIKKILEQFDTQTAPIVIDRGLGENDTDLANYNNGYANGYIYANNKCRAFLITTHIQQLEEEIEVLEGMELKEYDGLDRLVHKNIGYNTALHDLITLKQQQIQEAKKLLNNK